MNNPINSIDHRSLAGEREQRFLTSFFVLYKTSRIVDEKNDTFINQLKNFLELFHSIADEYGSLTLKTVGGHIFINDSMVRFDPNGLSGASDVLSEWSKLGLGGVHFESDISDEEIGRFFKFISSLRPDDHNLETTTAALIKSGLNCISLLSSKILHEERKPVSEEERQKFRKMARTSFFRAMSVVSDVMVASKNDQEINSSKTKRVVHGLIDQITRDEQSMLELTAIRDYDDYTYAHSTNVAVYALTLGVRIGLDRARLSQLGFSALFHDVGKVKLPLDLIKKPDAFDEDDWLQMQKHPLLGAKTILRNMKLDIHTARAARSAFEHHINNDFTGYPMLHYKKRVPNLFSKIISIVDTFDALSSGRVYLKKSIQPDEVLKKMRYQMAIKFDPFLLKIFNDVIGIYPAGTLTLLTTREIALVLSANTEYADRPYVKIVGNVEGILANPLWIDLAQPEHADRKIVRQIDPARYGLKVSDFVLDT